VFKRAYRGCLGH